MVQKTKLNFSCYFSSNFSIRSMESNSPKSCSFRCAVNCEFDTVQSLGPWLQKQYSRYGSIGFFFFFIIILFFCSVYVFGNISEKFSTQKVDNLSNPEKLISISLVIVPKNILIHLTFLR